MRTALIVRTHYIDATILDMVARYATVPGLRVVVVCDETKGKPQVPAGLDYVAMDAGFIARQGLPSPSDVGWRCGDYFFYAARAAGVEADHYWMVEPDVLVHFARVQDFFALFAGHDDVDLFAPAYGPANATWLWSTRMQRLAQPVHGCFFPVTRLSARAVDHLRHKRAASAPLFASDAELVEMPNDESFVATTLTHDGFVCRDLHDARAALYSLADTFHALRPLSPTRLLSERADDRIYHAVVRGEPFRRKALHLAHMAQEDPSLLGIARAVVPDARLELSVQDFAAYEAQLDLAARALALFGGTDRRTDRLAGEIVTLRHPAGDARVFLREPRDYISTHFTRGLFYEQAELVRLCGLMPPGAVVIDVGAHIGGHALFMAIYGRASRVHCIVPHPVACEDLVTNIALNSLAAVIDTRLLNCALRAEAGAVHVDANPLNSGDARVVPGHSGDPRRDARAIRGDAIAHIRCDVLKLDVGQDFDQAWPECARLIERHRPIVYCTCPSDKLPGMLRFASARRYRVEFRQDVYGAQVRLILVPAS